MRHFVSFGIVGGLFTHAGRWLFDGQNREKVRVCVFFGFFSVGLLGNERDFFRYWKSGEKSFLSQTNRRHSRKKKNVFLSRKNGRFFSFLRNGKMSKGYLRLTLTIELEPSKSESAKKKGGREPKKTNLFSPRAC